MKELSVQGDLTYTEYPVKILDTLTRVTRNKVFLIFSLVLPKSRGRDSC
jgi:hypothetical protein